MDNKLHIEVNNLPDNLCFVVIDILGKTIQQDFIENNNTTLDYSDDAASQYFMKIQIKAGKPVQTFKLWKAGYNRK